MDEEIQKIKAEELKAIRLVFPDTKGELGQIVELTMAQAIDWADKATNQDVRRNLPGHHRRTGLLLPTRRATRR